MFLYIYIYPLITSTQRNIMSYVKFSQHFNNLIIIEKASWVLTDIASYKVQEDQTCLFGSLDRLAERKAIDMK